jgi:hypothetical protein
MRDAILIPESETLFTPKEFSKVSDGDRVKIATVRVSPPRFGRHGFGVIVVKWKHPQLRPKLLTAKYRKNVR